MTSASRTTKNSRNTYRSRSKWKCYQWFPPSDARHRDLPDVRVREFETYAYAQGCVFYLKAGDWCVYNESGLVAVLSDAQFQKLYEADE